MNQNLESLWETLAKSSEKLDSTVPSWFKENRIPEYKILDSNGERVWSEADRIAYQKRADAGEPIMILLHGLFGALSNWDSTLPLFNKYTASFALQFPLLTSHRSEVQVKALALYTELFIRTNFKSPVILCGNSLGGHVALRLCLTSPELVSVMVLSGASGLYEHSVDTLPLRPSRDYVRDHMKRVFFKEEHITDSAIEEIYQILTNKLRTLSLVGVAKSAKKDNLQDLLGNISRKTLLLWGEDDLVTTMPVAQQFHSLIPDSELHSMKNCGHAPMIEYPEWFSNQVETFLKDNKNLLT